jgi:hypothetical protein
MIHETKWAENIEGTYSIDVSGDNDDEESCVRGAVWLVNEVHDASSSHEPWTWFKVRERERWVRERAVGERRNLEGETKRGRGMRK